VLRILSKPFWICSVAIADEAFGHRAAAPLQGKAGCTVGLKK
jgi:hypothetical protein